VQVAADPEATANHYLKARAEAPKRLFNVMPSERAAAKNSSGTIEVLNPTVSLTFLPLLCM
jgi:hypothetical protein